MDLQEELQIGSWERSYWTDGGSGFHPHTSRWTYKRNFKQDHGRAVTELIEILSSVTYISFDLQAELQIGSCQRWYWTDGWSCLHPHTPRWTYKRNCKQDHASTVTEQLEILSSVTYISFDLQEELETGSCQRWYWTDGGSGLNPHTACCTYKRNFKQDHARAVTEQTEDLVFIHIHIVGPTRGTSNRIMPGPLLNRQRILSSFTYISLDLQEELQTGSCQGRYWTDRGSCLHSHTSRWTYKRNFKQDYGRAVTEQTENLVLIHIHLVVTTRGSSNRIMAVQLLNRQRVMSSSTYISLDLQEDLETGSCKHSNWTDGWSCPHSHTSRWAVQEELETGSCQRWYWTDGWSCLHSHTSRWAVQEELETGSLSCQRWYWTDRGSCMSSSIYREWTLG